jgi:hypothetical protein
MQGGGEGKKRSASFSTICRLSRENKCPKKDLATPIDKKVTLTQAYRLRKRMQRTSKQEITITSFPKNKGYVAYHDGTWQRKKNWKIGQTSTGCCVCGSSSSTYCVCGVAFETDVLWAEVTNFVRYVRSPTNPILFMTDPVDQKEFESVLHDMVEQECVENKILGSCRGAVIGAISGRADVVRSLQNVIMSGTVHDFASGAQKIAERHGFFRGGQAHGGLAINKEGKKNVYQAVLEYCEHFESELLDSVQCWHGATSVPVRRAAARSTLQKLSQIAVVFCAKVQLYAYPMSILVL